MERNEFRTKHEWFGAKSLPNTDEEEMIDQRPTLLHVALNAPTYSSAALSSAFTEAGYNTQIFDWQKIKINEGIEGMRDRLMTKVKLDRPNVIFLHLQNEDAITLEIAKELAGMSFVVNYTFDVRDDERMKWMDDMAPHIGLTLFASQEDVDRCYEKGVKNTSVIQSSCDMEVYRPIQSIKSGPDILFVGGKYINTNLSFPLAQERQDMIDFLKMRFGDNFKSFGIGQENSRYVHPHEEVHLYNQCKIAINHNNFDRTLYSSDRIWRIIASGAFCLTKYFKGIEMLFPDHRKLGDTWASFDELYYKIHFYMSDGAEERVRLSQSACDYVRTHHTWRSRVEEMKALIQKHSKNTA